MGRLFCVRLGHFQFLVRILILLALMKEARCHLVGMLRAGSINGMPTEPRVFCVPESEQGVEKV